MASPFMLAAQAASTIGEIHRGFGWWVVGIWGVVGCYAIGLHLLHREPGRSLWLAIGLAVVSVLTHIGMGLYAFSSEGIEPGNKHIFYGVVTLFTLAFAYIYRAQFSKRPALAYGLLGLFLMGIGIRAIMSFGQSF